MVSAVRSRPTHYEMLGLAPTASSEEIARAFATEIGMFRVRAMGGVAEVSIAYETLRDPVRRRAYDASLGLAPEPEPEPRDAATAWRDGSQFFGLAPVRARPSHDKLPPPAAVPMEAQPRPEPVAEPKTASFIAASLRELADPAPHPGIVAAPKPQPEPEATPKLDSHELRLGDAEERPVEWRRPATIIGGLVAAVVLGGGLLGWQAGHEPRQLDPAMTAPLPAPKPLPVAVSPPAAIASAPVYRVAEAQPQPRRRPRVAVASARGTRVPAPPATSQPQFAEGTQAADTPPEAIATTQAAAPSTPVETVAAAMPLSNATVARTIHKIGYACGQVASTSAVEGGGYKVTCTSGHSYEAKPVRGRYRFRRLGNH
jgi:hypothetical protein